MSFLRSHTCGDLNQKNEGQSVRLLGWAAKRRDHGGIIFIDLRDRYGVTQIVIDPSISSAAHQQAEHIRNEYVVQIEGRVRLRPSGMENPRMSTGRIEVTATSVVILSESKPLPFPMEEGAEVSESLRLKYRYLDLRRPALQRNLLLRHKTLSAVRSYLDTHQFLEIETPILYKSTPEGARDYIVPSRVNPGTFYALPQSPQTLKQLLMVGGMDRYYQVARCFRDEDLRADRQPEFSQIDIEVSFPEQESFFSLMEGMLKDVFQKTLGLEIKTPFARLSYDDAMRDYGVDKPDTRFELKLSELNDVFEKSDFNVFKQTFQAGGLAKALLVPGAAEKFSRKDLDELTKTAGTYGAKGLLWYKFEQGATATTLSSSSGLSASGPAAKFLKAHELDALEKKLQIKKGDLLLIVADSAKVANESMGQLRLRMGKQMNLIDETKFNFLWVTAFPLLEYSPEEGRYYACHHPFTAPIEAHAKDLIDGKNLTQIKAAAYDVVLNGYEIGGGSFRIYNQKVQQAMFRALGLSEEEAQQKFGFFIEALQYGTPPHGGIAFGVDRIVMILAGTNAIRDVMAFPKTQRAQCLMSESPSAVTPAQLAELHISTRSVTPSQNPQGSRTQDVVS